MTTREVLLTIHITMGACWLGADVVNHMYRKRWAGESLEAQKAYVRMLEAMHAKYYAIVAVLILLSGIGLVQESDWAWSSKFIWVGVATIVLGGALGGGRLGPLSKQRLEALEAGDTDAAGRAAKRMLPVEIILTSAVIVTIAAMVTKWGA